MSPVFEVDLEREATVTERATVTVEAPSKEEAADAAKAIARTKATEVEWTETGMSPWGAPFVKKVEKVLDDEEIVEEE